MKGFHTLKFENQSMFVKIANTLNKQLNNKNVEKKNFLNLDLSYFD